MTIEGPIKTQAGAIGSVRGVPQPAACDVRLARLRAWLGEGAGERVLQVYGPIGLGKTTLVASYIRGLADAKARYRWLTLQAENTESSSSFWQALANAIQPQTRDDRSAPWDRIRAATRQATASNPLTLVVDANGLDVGDRGAILGELVHRTDEHLRLLFITRRSCAPMLAQLRSPHLVRSLEPAQLLFTREESRQLHSATSDRTDDPPTAAGWPLAEAISATSAEHGSSALSQTLLDAAGGLLQAAIQQGIWDPLSHEAQRALAETAMLEGVDEHFIAQLLAPQPVYPVLHELQTLAPLVSRTRGDDQVHSFHPLLRAFALRKLEMNDPADRNRVYRQALLYHAERRSPEAAIALVQDSIDDGLARMAFETFTSTELLRASGYNRVRAAMARLTPAAAEQSGQIRITQAIVAMKEGRFPEARRLLGTAREMLSEDLAYQSPALSRVYTDFVIAQHVLAFHSHTELTEAQLAEGHFWSTFTNDLTNAAFVGALRSLHYLRIGHLVQAQQQIDESREKYERATSYYGLGSALLVDAMIALAAGRLSRAEGLAVDASVLISRAMPDEAGLTAVAECLRCEVQLERNLTAGLFARVDAALRDLEACDGWPDAFVIGYSVGTRCALIEGEPLRALALLDRAVRLMRSRGLSDIERYCQTLRRGVLARLPDAEDQLTPSREIHDASQASKVGWRESDEAALVECRAALRDGDPASARTFATQLRQDAGQMGRNATAIRAYLIKAVAAMKMERPEEAAQELYDAVLMAEPEQIVLPFVEHGADLLVLLEAMKVTPAYRTAGRSTRSFCAGLLRMTSVRVLDRTGGIAFAPRELQVLRCLARRQSTKAIARELGLSASAVKFHLGNIFRKLGVNKRSDAVAEAQQRGLIV